MSLFAISWPSTQGSHHRLDPHCLPYPIPRTVLCDPAEHRLSLPGIPLSSSRSQLRRGLGNRYSPTYPSNRGNRHGQSTRCPRGTSRSKATTSDPTGSHRPPQHNWLTQELLLYPFFPIPRTAFCVAKHCPSHPNSRDLGHHKVHLACMVLAVPPSHEIQFPFQLSTAYDKGVPVAVAPPGTAVSNHPFPETRYLGPQDEQSARPADPLETNLKDQHPQLAALFPDLPQILCT